MQTLDQLVQRIISNARFEGIEDVLEAEPWLREYKGEDWKNYLKRLPGNSNCIHLFRNKHARLSLILWDGNYRSEKHGHPERGCLLKVLSGVLLETRYHPVDTDRVTGEYTMFKGDMGFIHDALAYHTVENPLAIPAVSLHLYSPGNTTSPAIRPAAVRRTLIG